LADVESQIGSIAKLSFKMSAMLCLDIEDNVFETRMISSGDNKISETSCNNVK
jgi:hypothetical protein